MPYAAASDFIDRFGAEELRQLTGATTATPQLDQAISDTNAEIDAYLAVRFALPLDPVPAVLIRLACDIIRYRLWDAGASEEVAKRYQAAVKFLTAVSQGSVRLGTQPPSDETAGGGNALTQASPRVFDRDSLSDY